MAAWGWLYKCPAFSGALAVFLAVPSGRGGPGSASNANDAAGFKPPTSWWADVRAAARRRTGQHGEEGELGGTGGRPQA